MSDGDAAIHCNVQDENGNPNVGNNNAGSSDTNLQNNQEGEEEVSSTKPAAAAATTTAAPAPTMEAATTTTTTTATEIPVTDEGASGGPREGEPSAVFPVVPTVRVEIDGDRPPPPSQTDKNAGRKLVGKKVETSFGVGVVVDYRNKDGVYEIQLGSNDHKKSSTTKSTSTNTLYSVQVPKVCPPTQAEIANDLNVAYEALEKMRRLNLDLQCYELGIPSHQVDYDRCTSCLLANKGSTKSHFPQLQRMMDDVHDAATDLDKQVETQLPSLHKFFNVTLPSSATNAANAANDAIFNTNPRPSRSSRMANRISASLQEAGTLHTNTTTPKATAAVPATSKQAGHAKSSANGKKPGPANAKQPSPTTKPVAANGGKSNAPPAAKPKKNVYAHAAENRATKQPPQNIHRARINKLWGSIKSLPQPAGVFNNQTKAPSNSASTTAATASTASTAPPTPTTFGSPQNLPGFQTFMNSRVTKTIFGENKVKEDGSTADPNIIMNNRISNSKLDESLSPSCKPVPAVPKSDKPIALPRIQRLINNRKQANTSPCLICASPSCASCSSKTFRKEGITLCLKCERLFELDFIVDCVSTSDPTQRAERIEYMVDCYDRAMLLLRYSKQFVEQIASSLEDQKNKQDKIGLASSSVGVVSGILGIAAAATILTPAGAPLLIASLFFGGSATTVQSGTEALNYLSEPRKLADRIIALHGMSLSILRVTSTLRDAMMRDHIRTDVYEVEAAPIKNQVKQKYEKNKTNIVMGSNFGRSLTAGAFAGVEAGAMGGAAVAGTVGEASAMGAATAAASTVSTAGAAGARVSTTVSRAGTAAARTVRFARFAGGALSAAVLVMEANAIQSTVKSISQGSPCDKADTLRNVMATIDDFPSTTELDDECQAYLKALASRPEPPVEVDAVSLDDAHAEDAVILEAPCQQVGDDSRLCAPGAMILDPQGPELGPGEGGGHPTAAAVPVSDTSASSSSFLRGSSSLFSRMQTRREDRRDDRRAAAEEVVAVAVADNQLGESNFSLVL